MGPRSAEYYARYLSSNDDPLQDKGAFALLLLALTSVLPAWGAQKLLLFLPWFLAGYGAHRLAARRVGPAAALFAGLVYALSPFAYIRGVAGQLGVLWAYALAPWFLLAWMRAADGSRRALAAAALLAGLTAVFQAQGLVLLMILVAVHTAVRLFRAPRSWRAALARPAALGTLVLLLTASWVVPVLLAPRTTLDGIGTADRAYFQTTSSGMPSVGVAALTLQGFWRAGYEGPYEGRMLLLVAPIVLVFLCVHGLRAKPCDDLAVTLAIGGGLGFVLATALATPVVSSAWDFAWDHVPLLRGFRDAQKFLALLALAYADLGAVGAQDLLDRLRRVRAPRAAGSVALAALLILPVATAMPLVDGFGGQLGVAQYPAEWDAAEAATRDCHGSMLALPFHLYMDASWLPNDDKRVTTPAKLFFSCPLVASDDVEAGGTAPRPADPTDAYVSFVLQHEGATRSMGNLLSVVAIQYVLVLKESDWQGDARALADQTDMRLLVDNARVQVWENQRAVSRTWRTDQVVPIASWDDLLPLADARPLAGVVLARPGAVDAGRHVVFTPSPAEPAYGWTMGGRAPVTNMDGLASVFDDVGAEPARSRFVEWGTWAITALACAGLVVALARRDRDPREDEGIYRT